MLQHMIVLSVAIASCMAAPTVYARDESTCMDNYTSSYFVNGWFSLLHPLVQEYLKPAELLTTDYTEYSASYRYLNAACTQSKTIDTAQPVNTAIYNNLAGVQAASSSNTKAALQWQPTSTAYDCTTGVLSATGFMSVGGDASNTKVHAVAQMGTVKNDAGSWKIKSANWEFDHWSLTQVLTNMKQCDAPVGNSKLPTIL